MFARVIGTFVFILASGVIACGSETGGDNPCALCAGWEKCVANVCTFNPASQWDLIAQSGLVAERNSAGETWDALGGAPDPYVCVTLNGATKCTTAAQDTFSPAWYEKLVSKGGGGSLMGGIAIGFYDDDVSNPDTICSGNVTVSEESFALGSFTKNCAQSLGSITFQLQFVY
jgi:hypothetical protein